MAKGTKRWLFRAGISRTTEKSDSRNPKSRRWRLHGGSLLDIQLDIVVSYGDPEKGDLPTIHKLRGVQFTEDPRETNQGDKFQDLKLPFLFLRRE